MRPFRCPATILNTLDLLGKFDGKADEGFLVGYSINRKAFRVFNTRTRKVEENMHIKFLENKPNVAGSGIETNVNAGKDGQEKASNHEYILLPLMLSNSPLSSSSKSTYNKDGDEKEGYANNTNRVSTINPSVSTVGQGFDNADDQERIDSSTQDVNTIGSSINTVSENINIGSSNINTASPIPNDPSMQSLEATGIFDDACDKEEVGAEADLNKLETTMNISSIPTTRIHKDHPIEQIIGDLHSVPLTRRIWIEAMQEELLESKLQKEVYVCQPPGFEDPQFPDKVYKVEKALYGLHQAPRAWYETLSIYLLENGYRRGTIDKTLFIKKDRGDILLVQVYVDDNIFGSTKKSLCVEFEQMMHKRFQTSSMGELTFFLGLQVQQKEDGIFISQDKSMIRSLMYLTTSRPDIMFVVYACARFQVTPKVSHLHAMKRIFRYLKGQPKLGLWYPMDSPFDLEAFSDSDYAGANLDRKSTTGGCQFLGKRLISWQCKKQTIVANSTIEAEYVAAANYCGQVLWIQNQMLDYGFNFMNTKIYIDNKSTICIVKNLVFYYKTKHIEIMHHFIRDSYEKKLIQVIKIHTDYNVAYLLTKAFDVSRFKFLIASIRLLNLRSIV
ncbi:putative ribonuclease H-like domain-containing protein [Tanacetum coccineum]